MIFEENLNLIIAPVNISILFSGLSTLAGSSNLIILSTTTATFWHQRALCCGIELGRLSTPRLKAPDIPDGHTAAFELQ